MRTDDIPPFLEADEPAPFAVVNGDAGRPILLVCDHASSQFPRAVGDMGLDAAARRSHRAVDIGAGALAHRLGVMLGASAVLAGYSRLVVDCNRDLRDAQAFVEISDGIAIPGNRGLSDARKRVRAEWIYWPYHRAIDAQVTRLVARGNAPLVLAIHSFTPVFGGVPRPWEVGVLWDADDRTAALFMDGLAGAGLIVGDNQPYSGHFRNLNDTLVRHAAAAGLPHACIEVRQDLIDRDSGLDAMAATLCSVVDALPSSVYSVASHAFAMRKPAHAQDDGVQAKDPVARQG